MLKTALRVIALALMLAIAISWPASNLNFIAEAQSPQARPSLEPGSDRAWWEDSYTPRQPQYSGVARASLYIPMRDGVRLALDLYLPENLEAVARLPTILEQTRYHRAVEFKPEARNLDKPSQRVSEFVTRGYAYVIVDVRGSGASFGNRPVEFSREEVRDGRDVVDWIVKQPWSDGKVGTTGVSYVGTTAELLLVNEHPAVKACAPQFSLFDAWTDISYPGGIHLSWFSQAWGAGNRRLDDNQMPPSAPIFGVRPVDEDRGKALLNQAIKEHATNIDIHKEVSAVTHHDDRAPNGWTYADISPYNYIRNLTARRVPVYSIGGWLDGGYPDSVIHRFLNVPGSRLLIGPWSHGGRFYFSPLPGPRTASFAMNAELLRFFDYHLKGIKTGIESDPLVHYYTMGEDKWHSTNAWPLPNAQNQTWYLSADNALGQAKPPAGKSFDAYKVDLTAGTGNQARWNTLLGGGLVNYPDRAEADRKLLTYTSAPLAQDVEVTGHPVVTLYVSSTATDGQFFVYLEEVDENGKVGYVTEGELRALHRQVSKAKPPYRQVGPYHTFNRRDARPLVPGRIAELTFDMIPTSNLFRKGHRIRVAIAGADKDHFAPMAGDAPTVQVYRGGAYASRIDLPTVLRP